MRAHTRRPTSTGGCGARYRPPGGTGIQGRSETPLSSACFHVHTPPDFLLNDDVGPQKWFSKAKNAVEGRIFKLKGSPPPPSLTQLGKVSSKSSLKKTKRQYDTNKSMSFADIERNPCWTPHRGGIDM
ncbi:MAG: hypothetical protein BJ554DRAFT_2392, partial [Olpidium bornovanus]